MHNRQVGYRESPSIYSQVLGCRGFLLCSDHNHLAVPILCAEAKGEWMSFDESVANRVRTALASQKGMTERRMFGGLAFLLNGNMCCGVLKDELVLRLGPDRAEAALKQPHVREMDFSGKPMKSMVYVEPGGFATQAKLSKWLRRAVEFTSALPSKK